MFDGDVLWATIRDAGPGHAGLMANSARACSQGRVTSASFEAGIRKGYGAKADVVLAANPHKTDAEGSDHEKNIFRVACVADVDMGTAVRERQREGVVYYFDVRRLSLRGARRRGDWGYVFGNLGGRGGRRGSPGPRAGGRCDVGLVSSYWVNFAKTGDPTGPVCRGGPRSRRAQDA